MKKKIILQATLISCFCLSKAFSQCSVSIVLVSNDCHGTCEGDFYASPVGTAPFQYQWSTTDTTWYLNYACENISYTVTVTDSTGCIATASITLPPHLDVTVSTTNTSCGTCADGTATAIVSGGCPPYWYIWNNGNITNPINNLIQGLYYVQVTDSCGCSVQDTGSVLYIVGIDPRINAEVANIFPNPFFNILSFSVLTGRNEIKIYNAVGERVFEETMADSRKEIDTRGLPRGVYFISIRDEKNTLVTKKIVKM